MNTFVNICLIYGIKKFYCIPNSQSKLFYIYCMSPIVLCNGIFSTNVVSKKYWKFLRMLSYPRAKGEITYENGNCTIFHEKPGDCYNMEEFKDMFKNIFLLYFNYYSLHGIYLLTLKKYRINDILLKEVKNMIQSTSFLFLQNFFQRIILCSIKDIKYYEMYFLTSMCSNPVILEKTSRVTQINTMMLSNVIIGIIDKYFTNCKNKITLVFILFTFYKNKKLDIPALLFSIINGLREYTSIKKQITNTFYKPRNILSRNLNITKNEDSFSILSVPWHPFL